LTFAYRAQCRCDPKHTPDYFTSLSHIFDFLQTLPLSVSSVPELRNFVTKERSRGRFTHADHAHAVRLLGFGPDGPLRTDFNDTVEDEFIICVWRDGVLRLWREPEGSSVRRGYNEAFRIVAEMRGSEEMKMAWREEGERQR
jgi:ubiquitin carboxyl-terminal hydrolase 25/28